MLAVDLHTHSIRSRCGIHTHLELIQAAAAGGLRGIAITDHGTALGGPGVSATFVKRFPAAFAGVRVWKGIEGNILRDGTTDVPPGLVSSLDIILIGLHDVVPGGLGEDANTELLVGCLRRNPWLDVIVHPDIASYPVRVREVVRVAAELGMAVEFDNANASAAKTDLARMRAMADEVLATGCAALISGDAHTVSELGEDAAVLRALDDIGAPAARLGELLLSSSLERAEAFIAGRRQRRREVASAAPPV
jgi:putative hydrolase